jgi:carbonic anhydrase
MKFVLILLATFFFSCMQHRATELADNRPPLDKLKSGNKQFVSGHPLHPHETLQRIKELKQGQHPFVVLVSCSDSRIPPEIIFDQGLGDIFSIRTAGNIIGDVELGSIEYAVEHLHCKLIVVLGHENCGAIQAYADAINHQPTADHIQHLVDYIAAEEEEKRIPACEHENIDKLVKANIAHGVQVLRYSNPILKPLADKKEINIVSAYYDLDNGKVLFDH